MILILDNFDSFTYNIFHYVEELVTIPIHVKRNDEITVEDAGKYKGIIFSPGPGLPSEAGSMMNIIKSLCHDIPMLGICLGHQALGEAFGAKLVNLPNVLHGVQRNVNVIQKDDLIFRDIPFRFQTGHYHSWIISRQNFPDELTITAEDDKEEIMAITHKKFPSYGLQFHPESIMTEHGLKMMSNWVNLLSSS